MTIQPLSLLERTAHTVRKFWMDFRIRYLLVQVPLPTYREGLSARGDVLVPEMYGPDYPQVLIDLERMYLDARFRITKKMLAKAARRIECYRGVVAFSHPDFVAVHTLEFAHSMGDMLLVFLDPEYHTERLVRIVAGARCHHLDGLECYSILCEIADRLEYALLPKDVRLHDGGKSLFGRFDDGEVRPLRTEHRTDAMGHRYEPCGFARA